MRRSRKPIVIASRRSRLARVQTERVGQALARLHPGIEVEYRWIESEGDQLPGSLADTGGKGLFTRTLERALLLEQADLAVHSLKDLPAGDSPGLTIAAVPRRADVRDCLITRDHAKSLADLPAGAIVGTSSPRRAAQVLRAKPDLRVDVIRGNVETRLNKVLQPQGQPQYDATLLAAAGLLRLGLTEHTTTVLNTDEMLPAACQGALALQCRADDHVTLTRALPLNDPVAATAAHAERQILAMLNADCHSPIAVLVEPTESEQPVKRGNAAPWFRLRVRVMSQDGKTCLELDEKASGKTLRQLVKQVVKDLRGRGARQLMIAGRGVKPLERSAAEFSITNEQ